MGVGKYLKEKNPEVLIAAVEPKNCATLWCAAHLSNKKQKIVTVLPDRAERYFSTALI